MKSCKLKNLKRNQPFEFLDSRDVFYFIGYFESFKEENGEIFHSYIIETPLNELVNHIGEIYVIPKGFKKIILKKRIRILFETIKSLR